MSSVQGEMTDETAERLWWDYAHPPRRTLPAHYGRGKKWEEAGYHRLPVF